MATTYYANFRVNNGTTLIKDLEGTNKSELIRLVKGIALRNHYLGNTGTFHVWHKELSYGSNICDCYGKIGKDGRVSYVKEAVGEYL